MSDEPTQADIESAAEQQDEHFQRLFGPDWALMPTSVRLRETQGALAASQDDLTRVERERDEALAAQARLSDRLTESAVRLAMYRRGRDRALHEVAHLKFQLSMKQAQLDHLRAERDAAYEPAGAPGWLVARKGGRCCERCEGDIVRGQAYEEQPGTGGLVQHIHCPTSKEPTT